MSLSDVVGMDGVVARPALVARLESTSRVTLVSAPSGSGKTVLLRSWRGGAGADGAVAWVTAGPGEPDPRAFWLSVVDALRGTAPGRASVRGATAAPGTDDAAPVERLLADLATPSAPFWLVVDDAHELGPDVLRQLEQLIVRAPAALRFVLASRSDLRLGLHRLRLEGKVAEIRGPDLGFGLEESRELFAAAGVRLPERTLVTVHERAEGWVAGLRLAAQSLAGHPNPERFAAEFSGTERTVADYLLAEVLDRQDEDAREVLLRTSVLERVNGELADLLTGGSGRERVLQDLEQAGAFVVALDRNRSWFRCHRMFAELLRLELRRTAPEETAGLHRSAAGWFAEHGYPAEALRHAREARDGELVARLLADYWTGFCLDGQATLGCAQLDAFPEESGGADARPATPAGAHGPALSTPSTGVRPEQARPVRLAVAGPVPAQRNRTDHRLDRATVRARLIGASSACATERGLVAVGQAPDQGLPDESGLGVDHFVHGAELAWQGRPQDAQPWVERAERAVETHAEPALEVGVRCLRGFLELMQGDDAGALTAFQTAERMAVALPAAEPLVTALRTYQAQALARLGETDEAQRVLRGIRDQDPDRVEVCLATAVLRLVQDDPRAAVAALTPVLDGSAFPIWSSPRPIQAFLLEAVARDAIGDPAAAGRALERALDEAEPAGVLLWFLVHPVPELLARHAGDRTSHAALVAEIQGLVAGAGPRPAGLRSLGEPAHEPLRDSELRVLRYLATNLTGPEIADQLFISRNTLKTHMRNLYAKLGTHRRSETVARAGALGLVAPSVHATHRYR